MKRYIRASELKSVFGIARVTAWRWSRDQQKRFPKPIRLSASMTVYDTAEIEKWFNDRRQQAA